MTVLPTEIAVLAEALADLPTTVPAARRPLEAGLVRALRLTDPDYEDSITTGLTETFAAYDTRLGGNCNA